MENLYLNSLLFKFPNPESNNPEGFCEAKKLYTSEILKYFRVRNYIAATNFVGDVEVYVKVRNEKYNNLNFSLYNRFCLKINYNNIYNQPELVVSYERTMRICEHSLQQLSNIFSAPNTVSPLPLVNKVLHIRKEETGGRTKTFYRLRSLKGIEQEQNDNPQAPAYDKAQLFPIVNRSLQTFFDIPNEPRNRNRYTRYLTEIEDFIKQHLTNDFRKIIPLEQQFTKVDFSAIPQTAADLIFGKSHHNTTPRYGLNNGTYQQPPANDVVLFYIYPNNFDRNQLNNLYKYFLEGYGNVSPYQGLSHFIGLKSRGIGRFSIAYNSIDPNAAQYIAQQLEEPQRIEHLNNPNITFLCLFLSPISKNDADPEKHELYYKVKETLLRHNIASQCIDTNKLLEQLTADGKTGKDSFKYSLQNMSVAINAKLGGSPWILAGEQHRDLIIGIGAFRQNQHQYIGAAFMFDNVGAFNQYAYFSENNIEILAGAIQQKIEDFTKLAERPQRLIIHYYKQINHDEEKVIDNVLQQLNLEIPVFVLNINETESESVFVFDMDYPDRMPVSGRYISLGKDNYLLCNNVRYENIRYQLKDFAFPIKINIYCKNPNALTAQTKLELLKQVYQFSRIYWKSVSQQNMPVTIMYPKMIAEIMPHFNQKGVTEYVPTNRLWFL